MAMPTVLTVLTLQTLTTICRSEGCLAVAMSV
jgi:hypothetical protein